MLVRSIQIFLLQKGLEIMAKLGSAVSNSFSVGVAELRLGALSSAGKLSQADSIGLIDDAAVNVAQTKVELKGGFPRKVVAQAISEQVATVSATIREFSRKNLNIILGQGIPGEVTAVASTITADLLLNAGTATVLATAGFTVGDVAVIYQEGKPETVSLVKITAKTPTDISFAANSLAVALQVANGVINVYKANGIAVGDVSSVQTFSVSLIQQGASGKPQLWHFWKAAIGGNMDFATNASDYASSKLELSILEPTLLDVALGGPLVAQAALIAQYPMGMAILG